MFRSNDEAESWRKAIEHSSVAFAEQAIEEGIESVRRRTGLDAESAAPLVNAYVVAKASYQLREYLSHGVTELVFATQNVADK